ncbi:MFS transporter [Halegenticoccus soli]|uniref:MFS transporter n=1 Tax=Halegenticoccus soli TaxID=1985678 RepID=UPI000C6DE455|nr:MFS transporter [Halegenticoccus soli]
MALRLRGLARFDALALTALLWFLAKFLRYAFPPLFGTLRETFGVSNAALGATFSALMVAYTAMQFPAGALADRLGSVRVIAAGALVASAAAIALVAPPSFLVLVGGAVLVGLGTGVHKTVAVRLLSTIYPERTGRALGALDTVGAFGGAAAPAAVVAVAGAPGWGALFLASGVAGACLTVLFARRVPRRLPSGGDASPDDGDRSWRRYTARFADRRFAAFVAATVLFSAAYNGAVAFLPLYLTDEAGLSPALASLFYSALFLVSVVQMGTGELSDRVGRLSVIAALLAVAAAGLAVLLVGSTPLALAAGVLLFGVGGHGYRPVRGAYLVAIIPQSLTGGTLGIVRTASMAAGAASPALVGALSDGAGFDVAFGGLFVSACLSTALVAALLATRDRRSGVGTA